MSPIGSAVSGETAHEGNGTDATRRTASFPQLQAPYKVKPPAQSQGLQGVEERWDRKTYCLYGSPAFA